MNDPAITPAAETFRVDPLPGRRSRREAAAVGLFLIALLAVLFAEGLRPDRILAPIDFAFLSPCYRRAAPEGWTAPENWMLFDQGMLFIPWRAMLGDALREGRLPLWNPMTYCGTPFAATMQAQVFYPPAWIGALLGPSWGFVFNAILRLWVAGFGLYWLARHYGVGPSAALVAAVAWMLSGFNIVWLGFPLGDVVSWLPLLLLALDRALLTDSPRTRRLNLVLAALATAMIWLAGHAETTLDCLIVTGLWSGLRGSPKLEIRDSKSGGVGLWKWRWRGKPTATAPAIARCEAGTAASSFRISGFGFRISTLLIPVFLGTLLASVAWLPFLEWLPLSHEFRSRGNIPFEPISPRVLRHLFELPLVLVPDIFGRPQWIRSWGDDWILTNYHERILYAGALTPLLAAWCVWTMLRRPRRAPGWQIIWLTIGVLALGRALEVPPFNWLNQLPVLRLEHPTRQRMVWTFAMCLLAGGGWQALLDRADGRGWFRLLCATGTVAAAVLAAVCPLESWRLWMPAAALAVATALLAPRRFRPGFDLIAPLVIAADLLLYGSGYNPAIDRRFYFPDPGLAAIADAADPLARTVALDRAIVPDHHQMAGFREIGGGDFQLAWLHDYLELAGDVVRPISYGLQAGSLRSPLVRPLNVGHVLAVQPETVAAQVDVDWVAERGEVQLGRLRNVHPRSFMVYEAVHAADDAEARALLAAEPEAVTRRVVLSATAGPLPPAQGPAEPSKVELLEYAPEYSVWRVTTDAPGYLVTTDSWYPGWRAEVDGEPRQLLRANLAFRAVAVEPGTHIVTHRYRPAWLMPGAALAGLALMALVGMLRRQVPEYQH